VSKNGIAVSKTGELSATQGTCSFTVPASEIQASTLASQGKGIIIKASATVLGAATQEEFLGGAVIDFDKITAAATEPSDYETFWKSQIERVEAVSPLDTSVTAYTGTGVVISDIKRLNNDVNNQGTFSTTEGQLITDYNYFRIIKVDKERLDYLHSKDLCTGTTESKLNSYSLYEVYLKSPGPTPCVGMLSIPDNLTADTEIVVSTCGYGACPPSLGAYGGVVRFVLSHNGYWADASDAELYDELYNGILGSYGRGNGKPNSGYDDPADCYILYMFLRNLQGLRFISDIPSVAEVAEIEDANLKAIYEQLNALKALGGGKIRLAGNSMGGYQTIGGAALAELYNKYNSESAADITVTYADPEVPAFTNLGGHVLDGRLKNAFGIYYVENMNYFEPAFFAPRIKAEVNILRCGLGDYTCPPSGIIATYNALKCKKTINVYQNSTHGYKIAEEKYIFTLTQDAQ
jgi:cephalosporin-C deacetylase-like acetyl esterase